MAMVEICPLAGLISSQLAGSYILEYLCSVRESQHEKPPQRGLFICFPGCTPSSHWELMYGDCGTLSQGSHNSFIYSQG